MAAKFALPAMKAKVGCWLCVGFKRAMERAELNSIAVYFLSVASKLDMVFVAGGVSLVQSCNSRTL